MKKNFLFALSIAIAFGITLYIKSEKFNKTREASSQWKTFVKKPGTEIATHKTTEEEFVEASITPPSTISNPEKALPSQGRSPASVNPLKGFMVRKDRVLMGEIDQKYEDDDTPLKMLNKINPNWKDVMGKSLMRFQPEDTKIMVKEELPVIKIQEGTGRFLQQVSVTFLQKDGFKSSFRALVDSDTGSIVETWDRSIFEQVKRSRGELTLPSGNESGITTTN